MYFWTRMESQFYCITCKFLKMFLNTSTWWWFCKHKTSTAVVPVYDLLTYLLTPWSRVLLEKLTGSAASQEIPRVENLSMRELHLGNLVEGSFTGHQRRCVIRGSGDGPLSSQGPYWKPGRWLVYRGLREMNGGHKWRISLRGSSRRRTWRGGSFSGDTEGYAK